MGRKLGRQCVSVDQIENIVILSKKGLYRGEIAEKVGLSKQTIWNYQKKYDLL